MVATETRTNVTAPCRFRLTLRLSSKGRVNRMSTLPQCRTEN